MASIKTTEDIKSLFDVNFSPVSLKKLFLNRLGFDISKHHSAISASGFTDMEQSVSYRSDDDRAKLNALIDILSGDILLHTQHERDELINYYRNEGLLNNENYAIVDIGHNGTMQRSLFNLLGKQLIGYYFCTFSEIDKNITKDIGSAKGIYTR